MNNFFMTEQSKRLFELEKSRKIKEIVFFVLAGVVFLSVMIIM